MDTVDLEHNTPLHLAAASGDKKGVLKLLKHEAEVDASNIYGWTPLMQAARNGHKSIVSLLLRNGANIEKKNRYEMNSLLLASASGHIETIRLLLEEGAMLDVNEMCCQVSPLLIAALFCNDNVTRLFIDKGVSANVKSPKTNVTPIMCAAASGSITSVEMLVERGGRPEAVNCGGFSALDVAQTFNNIVIVDYLKEHTSKLKGKESKTTDIMEVAKKGDVKLLREIISNDPSKAKMATGQGATPLMMAAMMNHVSVAQILLQNGADINAQDYVNGWTALMQAIYHRNKEMVSFLIRKKADITIETLQGYTAFDLANEMMDADILKLFPSGLKVQLVIIILIYSSTSQSNRNMKKAQSTAKDYTPTISLTFDPIFSDISETNEASYTNVFSKLSKMQKEFQESMRPPEKGNQNRTVMPEGRRENTSRAHFSNALLIKKYKEGCGGEDDAELGRAGVSLEEEKVSHLLDRNTTLRASHLNPFRRRSLESFTSIEKGRLHFRRSSNTDYYETPTETYHPTSIGMSHQISELLNARKEKVPLETFEKLTPEDFLNLRISKPRKIDKFMKH